MKNEGVGQAASERQAAAEADSIVCDKTRWMRRLWEDGRAVTVVSRPSGFGKTHFLTRLRAFFEMDYARPVEPAAAARELFAGTEIRQDASFCDANLGRWPVVFLSLEAVQGESFDDLVQSFASVVAQQAKAHEWLLASPRLPDDLKSDFADLLRLPELPCEQRKAALRNALRDWTDALAESCGRSVVVLVDDYDAPLVQARRCGALAEMSFLMRSFFGRALKDARSVRKAVLMGRFAPEPSDECHQFAFRGLADPWLAGAFGFTAAERDELLAKAGLLARKDEAIASCGGWRFGGEEVSRPADWLRFCQNQAAREPALDPAVAREVCDFLEAADEAQLEDFKRLLAGAMIEAPAADALAVSDLDVRSDRVQWSRLWLAGVVTVVAEDSEGRQCFRCPNAAVASVLRQTVRDWLTSACAKARSAGDEWADRGALDHFQPKRDDLASAGVWLAKQKSSKLVTVLENLEKL